jgi:hypothetical protein
MNVEEIVNDWYEKVGIRLIAPEHGSANGHEWYLKQSLKYGIQIGFDITTQLLKENDPTKDN